MIENDYTLTANTNSGPRVAEEGVEFITVTDGNGGKMKLMNIEHEMYAPKEGIVELVPLKFAKGYGNAIRHKNAPAFSCIKDKQTGWLIGMQMPGYGRNKEIQFERIKLDGGEFLDLSIPRQRLKFICLKNGPFVKGSPNFQSQSKTIYEIVDKEKQAVEFHKNRKARRKASEIAESLHGEELVDMAVALGIDPKMYSTTHLEMEVIKSSENPEKVNGKTGSERFLEIYHSDTRLELTTLKRALSVGVLTENINQGINYNGLSLGFTESEAVNYLKINKTTFTSIDIQSRQKQSSSTQVFDTFKAPVVKDDKDAIIARQNREMEEMRTRLAQMNDNASEDKSEDDNELLELIAEGKRLKIGGPHLVGKNDPIDIRKQKLREKIAEANSKVNN